MNTAVRVAGNRPARPHTYRLVKMDRNDMSVLIKLINDEPTTDQDERNLQSIRDRLRNHLKLMN